MPSPAPQTTDNQYNIYQRIDVLRMKTRYISQGYALYKKAWDGILGKGRGNEGKHCVPSARFTQVLCVHCRCTANSRGWRAHGDSGRAAGELVVGGPPALRCLELARRAEGAKASARLHVLFQDVGVVQHVELFGCVLHNVDSALSRCRQRHCMSFCSCGVGKRR